MTDDAVQHGAWHFLLTITLPGGATITSFVPKSKFLNGDDDARNE